MFILMRLTKTECFSFFLIFIISLLFSLELFLFPGRPATFDSIVHITIIAQFSKIIAGGSFPVTWMNNLANYGLPMGIFIQQLTSYLGGTITFLTHNPTASYNLLIFVSIFLSNIFLYFFLRLYFTPLASFLGTFIFNFTPYHIFNVYVRGDLAEIFSSIFLPLILISLYLLIARRKTLALFFLALLICGLALTHPMMLVIYAYLFIPYLFFLLFTTKLPKYTQLKLLIASFLAILVGLLIAGYYLLPLVFEIKYFYYGIMGNHIKINNFLSLGNYFDPRWYYFTKNEIFTRGHVLQLGLIETATLITGFVYLIYKKFIQKSKQNIKILYFALISAALLIFFTTEYSSLFFQKIFFLNSLQYPWRLLSGLIFFPPVVAAFLYDQFPKKLVLVLVIFLVALFSFPQLYGKNFSLYPTQSYYGSKENVQSVLFNTIWTGKSEDYPDKNPQAEIIEGKGKITAETLKNSSRTYIVDAQTNLSMVDHTFYFPGWTVFVDGVKTNIEFQNPEYRGVITYKVPAGVHEVVIVFEDTKVRLLGKIISLIALITLFILFILRKRIKLILE